MFGLFDENREIISVLLALTQNNESFARKKLNQKRTGLDLKKQKLNQMLFGLFYLKKTVELI